MRVGAEESSGEQKISGGGRGDQDCIFHQGERETACRQCEEGDGSTEAEPAVRPVGREGE